MNVLRHYAEAGVLAGAAVTVMLSAAVAAYRARWGAWPLWDRLPPEDEGMD